MNTRMIGPVVPVEIQEVRNKRLNRDVPNGLVLGNESGSDNESDDDIMGPSLKDFIGINEEEEEFKARERLMKFQELKDKEYVEKYGNANDLKHAEWMRLRPQDDDKKNQRKRVSEEIFQNSTNEDDNPFNNSENSMSLLEQHQVIMKKARLATKNGKNEDFKTKKINLQDNLDDERKQNILSKMGTFSSKFRKGQ
ncbi:hypothetical protein PACTADRAFT_3922 [Pachysolen tannophilus NRRL Y-2460]|uniref:Uncharacterized protein n=1 Tax=Pachysolen tannophilus NRRL Y-2460 TaxID=669874 RepID=A0A1E4TTH3_PACTA|nr:hypothetical protein PACTADRAFT_3922 [Pachysolen tannophilus NRRL Y-2460]